MGEGGEVVAEEEEEEEEAVPPQWINGECSASDTDYSLARNDNSKCKSKCGGSDRSFATSESS